MAKLPATDFDQTLALNMTIALMECRRARDQVAEGEQAAVSILHRLSAPERKEISARLTGMCHAAGRPVPALLRSVRKSW